jgi:C4-dicarboxylate-specific signal transduction histidine kinase
VICLSPHRAVFRRCYSWQRSQHLTISIWEHSNTKQGEGNRIKERKKEKKKRKEKKKKEITSHSLIFKSLRLPYFSANIPHPAYL